MSKVKEQRLDYIRKLVDEEHLSTQDEIKKRLLEKYGVDVSQATVSRDMQKLGIARMACDETGTKYINSLSPALCKELLQGDIITNIEAAENIIVIKTYSGMAMAVAAAIDSLKIDNVVGCIAGDDTIMCIIKHKEDVTGVMDRLTDIRKKASEKKS